MDMAIFSFFPWTFMCPIFFLFFALGPSCVIIFFYSHVSFVILNGEREKSTHGVELYFEE
jgi:dolichyl-phosphate-mannose--protein O-mannosyl transferase